MAVPFILGTVKGMYFFDFQAFGGISHSEGAVSAQSSAQDFAHFAQIPYRQALLSFFGVKEATIFAC